MGKISASIASILSACILSSCCALFKIGCPAPKTALIDIKCTDPQKFQCDLGLLTISGIPMGTVVALDSNTKKAIFIGIADTIGMRTEKLNDTMRLEVATDFSVVCSGTAKDSIIAVKAKSQFQKSISLVMENPVRSEFRIVTDAINSNPSIKKPLLEYYSNNPNQMYAVVRANISTTKIQLSLTKSDSNSIAASIKQIFDVDAQINYTCGSSFEGRGKTSANVFIKFTQITKSDTSDDFIATNKDNISYKDYDFINTLTGNPRRTPVNQ